MMLSGEIWDPGKWSNGLCSRYGIIVREFYGILKDACEKVEEMMLIDDFEPDVPLISEIMVSPFDWTSFMEKVKLKHCEDEIKESKINSSWVGSLKNQKITIKDDEKDDNNSDMVMNNNMGNVIVDPNK
jgi:hypothetical protein